MPETIYALSSGPGKAAVSVIRISGSQAPEIARRLIGGTPAARQAALRRVLHPQSREVLDTALAIFFPAPNSATGEDLLELQVHGSRAVLRAIFDGLTTFSQCRPAEPGEFARRGFENGKLDLTAAEGIADLIDAETEVQRRQANRQASGHLARFYDDLRGRIIQAQALVESAIDFSDEADVAKDALDQATTAVQTLSNEINSHLAGSRRGEIIRQGFRVVIAGPPNAGKSSLLNRLARRDAAIVSDEAGTTRDVIEVHLDLDGLAVTLSDTAGMREPAGKIEEEGIRRAMNRADEADLIIWLDSFDDPRAPPSLLQRTSTSAILVRNKADVASAGHQDLRPDILAISAKVGSGIEELTDTIVAKATAAIDVGTDLVPTNHRHVEHLRTAATHLEAFMRARMRSPEFAAEDLRLAASAIGRLTGRIDIEDVLDQIFSRFCIGK